MNDIAWNDLPDSVRSDWEVNAGDSAHVLLQMAKVDQMNLLDLLDEVDDYTGSTQRELDVVNERIRDLEYLLQTH